MVIDNLTKERLLYLLDHLDSFIEEEAYRVLSDSAEDPHHSAITLCNLINSYLFVMKNLGKDQVSQNITEYLLDKCFTKEEIHRILESKAAEKKYYIGKVIE